MSSPDDWFEFLLYTGMAIVNFLEKEIVFLKPFQVLTIQKFKFLETRNLILVSRNSIHSCFETQSLSFKSRVETVDLLLSSTVDVKRLGILRSNRFIMFIFKEVMKYRSTRGKVEATSFEDVLFSGYAGDGGLFMPESIPVVDRATLEKWKGHSYLELTKEVMSLFIPPEEISTEDLNGKLLFEENPGCKESQFYSLLFGQAVAMY